jgi:hypothetical protein
MEEKVQEMLNKINEKFNDLEVRSVDLSLVRKVEGLANEIANKSPLNKLYFKLAFLFFVKEKYLVVGELYITIDKDKKTVEYEVGKIFRPKNSYPPKHLLFFVFDVKRYSSEVNEDVIATKEIFKEVFGAEGLKRDYIEHFNEYIFLLDADVVYYFV